MRIIREPGFTTFECPCGWLVPANIQTHTEGILSPFIIDNLIIKVFITCPICGITHQAVMQAKEIVKETDG